MTSIEQSVTRGYARQIAFSIAMGDWRSAGAYFRRSQNDSDVPDECKSILEAIIDGYQDKLDMDRNVKLIMK